MASQKVLRLGILLPTRGVFLNDHSSPDLSPLFALAEHAENAGLDSLWVGDSLTAKPRLEPLSTLAAIAMRTHKIKLGTAVLLAPLRRPVQLAQTAVTVDLLSSGRLTLGMGVGGVFTEAQRQEWFAADVPIDNRGARMTELVDICRQLWTKDNITFTGQYFNLERITLDPKPIQPGGIPMLLACHHATGSRAQFRRAADYGDGIIAISDTPDQYKKTLRQVCDIAIKAGRNPNALRAAFYMTVNLNRDRYAAWEEADTFIRSYYGLNFWADKWGPFGPPEETIQRIIEYHMAGATEIIVRFASPDQSSQLDTFTKEVVPAVMEKLKA